MIKEIKYNPHVYCFSYRLSKKNWSFLKYDL
jgi:hypothetical protein